MFCYKCGQQLPDEANFCFKCGHGNLLTFPFYEFGLCSCGFPVHPL
jgi:hypothetical protein